MCYWASVSKGYRCYACVTGLTWRRGAGATEVSPGVAANGCWCYARVTTHGLSMCASLPG
eukprot:1173018-Prorocentrum_minimum.AAC.1